EQLLAGLRRLAAAHPAVGDVRGLGLMAALEFIDPADRAARVPDADLTRRVQAEALQRQLIVLTCGTFGNVVRVIPPLVTTADEVDHALGVLGEALEAAGA